MTVNSRRKGKDGELGWVKFLKKFGFEARRGQQYSGASGDPDVVCPGLPRIHFEVKRTETLNPYKALEQAQQDAVVGKMPVVAHRRNRKDWIVIMYADDYLEELTGRSGTEMSPAEQKRLETSLMLMTTSGT